MELPINPPQRKGQPAIGIPPDKMAAFLNEMKTVRLRKVSENGTAAGSLGRKDIHSASINGTARNAADPPIMRHSMPLSSIKDSNVCCTSTGDKRKRDMTLCDLREDLRELFGLFMGTRSLKSVFYIGTAVKRRSITSSESSFASTSSLSRSLPSSSSLSRPWPSTSSTDVTTPSLCSDNDMDNKEADDGLPITPPLPPFRNAFRFRGVGIPVSPRESGKRRSIIDIDMLPDPPDPEPCTQPTVAPSPHTQSLRTTDLFSKRPPTSPLPPRQPKAKPRPPTRNIRVLPPEPPNPKEEEDDESDDEDPLSLSFASHIRERSRRSPTPLGSRTRRNGRGASQQENAETGSTSARLSGTHRSQASSESRSLKGRRLTLEEELRDAEVESNDDDAEVLTATGTWTPDGFLAHGGGGGVPVFLTSEMRYLEEGGFSDEEYLPIRRVDGVGGGQRTRRG